MQKEKKCPNCSSVIDENVKDMKMFSYQIHNKIISYNLEMLYCKKCDYQFYDLVEYFLINFFIEFLCALELKDQDFIIRQSEIVLKHLKEIIENREKENFIGEIRLLNELYLILQKIIKNNEITVAINEINKFLIKLSYIENCITHFNLSPIKFDIKTTEYDNTEYEYLKVTSLDTYIKITNKLKEKLYTWFRGLSNKNYKLIASIFRNQNNLRYESDKMIHFMLRAPSFSHSCPLDEEHMKWLPFMQHYELPTRLLDWTDSPLCALFFALSSDNSEEDSIVYSFNAMDWNIRFHKINIIPIIDKNKDIFPTSKFVENAFKYGQNNVELYPLAVVPIRKYNRMYNQQANFTIHDCGIDMYGLCPEMFIRIVIPKDYKQKIMKEMYNMGIDKTTYFPELTALAEVTKKFA